MNTNGEGKGMDDKAVVPGSQIINSILNLNNGLVLAAANHRMHIEAFRAKMRGKGVSDMQIEYMLDTALADLRSGHGSFVDNLDNLDAAMRTDVDLETGFRRHLQI